jgi:hypothetical protein
MPSFSSFARPTPLTVNWGKLNEDGDESHPRLNMTTLAAEAGLAIVAGSDTTGTSIASAMFFLIQNPSCFSRLRAELDEAAEGAAYDTEIDVQRLTELPYLQAVLNETMRIAPALPNGSQRLTPREGGPFVVADQYVNFSCRIRVCSSLKQSSARRYGRADSSLELWVYRFRHLAVSHALWHSASGPSLLLA